MSKNYDLYNSDERKIDNWRRRIIGYEKMKRDNQRERQKLINEKKKLQERMDKAIEYIEYNNEDLYTFEPDYDYEEELVDNYEPSNYREDLLDILKGDNNE